MNKMQNLEVLKKPGDQSWMLNLELELKKRNLLGASSYEDTDAIFSE
ncbi:MAG TPA: hypothetical protein VJK07_00890 [Candidatus Nanoarchaeia archaeon]|nr:hypothetical protein [Candidatus Nanoarchaeia archaeon]